MKTILKIIVVAALLILLGELMTSCKSEKVGCQLPKWHQQRKLVSGELTHYARKNLRH